jgi:hypothetical protein
MQLAGFLSFPRLSSLPVGHGRQWQTALARGPGGTGMLVDFFVTTRTKEESGTPTPAVSPCPTVWHAESSGALTKKTLKPENGFYGRDKLDTVAMSW